MTKAEYEYKLKSLHPQIDCDLRAKLRSEYISSLESQVETLTAENAQLKSQAIVWHEYPDECPKVDVKCLVMFDDGELIVTTHTGLLWFDIEKNWLDRITHWAYLPEPPKEEK